MLRHHRHNLAVFFDATVDLLEKIEASRNADCSINLEAIRDELSAFCYHAGFIPTGVWYRLGKWTTTGVWTANAEATVKRQRAKERGYR